MQHFKNLLTRMQASLWLIPAVMCGAMLGLAYVMVFSPLEVPGLNADKYWWLFSGDAATARDLVAAILSGTITMTSLIVSITMVVLSLASGQLGPRLIDNFLRDRQIQAVLGLFTGTVFYCLFVLRSIDEDLGADHVPHIAITTATILAMLCLLALLFYVHKVARSVVADTVVAQVAESLEKAILREGRNRSPNDGVPSQGQYALTTPVSLEKSGYVQVIEFDGLVDLAAREDLIIDVSVRPGYFVLRQSHALVVRSNAPISQDVRKDIRRAFTVGVERTPTQDLEYSVRQLVEIAVRALSPGVNDPFTAVAVINRLASALELAALNAPSVKHYTDDAGNLRVFANPESLSDLFDTALNQIRQEASRTPAVLIQLAHVCTQLASVLPDGLSRAALQGHLHKISRAGQRHIEDPADRSDFVSAIANAKRILRNRECCHTVGSTAAK